MGCFFFGGGGGLVLLPLVVVVVWFLVKRSVAEWGQEEVRERVGWFGMAWALVFVFFRKKGKM